jgi:hypothetical protein
METNSTLVTEIFTALYNISKRKTTEGYTFILLNSILEELQPKYPFLTQINLKDTRFIEEEDFISIDPTFNALPTPKICSALYDMLRTMNESLGKDAGPFFYKEISGKISDLTNETMQRNGIDLLIMQLEREIEELEKRIAKTSNQIQSSKFQLH